LERLILFSDAVFAIAITLLVIEIRIPELKTEDTHAVIQALGNKFSEFFAFILSFAVIGQFWISHHRLFGYVTGYTTGLLWLNLHMLFWIVLVPFTSGLNSHYGGIDLVWMIYSFNMFMIALSLHFIYRYTSDPKRDISTMADDKLVQKYSYLRGIIVAGIFLMGVLLCVPGWVWASWAARFVFFLIPVALLMINRRAKRAGKPAAK
ncbi:MAG: DUF1211 domain-containing protein, partial [Bacteroidetes bacterium]|nr:DUF1211 domain-containing protein [Bacteroidota bacterium]